MARFVSLLLDGVDYLHGHREEHTHYAPNHLEPGPEAARDFLQGTLTEGLPGIGQRLRAGWAAVRWLEAPESEAPARWLGPAYLFAFEAAEAGDFQLEFTGEDATEWPAPELG